MRSSGSGTLAPSGPHEMEVLGSPGEVIDLRGQSAALEAVTRAEIDTQIATAKRFPRSPARFLSEARSMVAVDPELAAQCTYRLPARKGGNGQPITGPSVRLAEIAAVCWGNLRVAGRITEDDGRAIVAQGVCIDLERNVGYSVEVRKQVVGRDGRRYGDDMVNNTCNAAIALATRNATFKAIPRAFVNLVEEAAQAVARGDVKSMPERTAKAIDWFRTRGVAEAEVFRALGVNGPADMNLDHLAALQGFKTAINEGHATVEEIFRPEPAPEPARGKKGSEGLAERLEGKASAKAEVAKPEPPAEREPGQD